VAAIEGVVADESQDLVAAARDLNGVGGSAPLNLTRGQWVLTTAVLLIQNPGLSVADFEQKKLVTPNVRMHMRSTRPIPSFWDSANDALRSFRFAQRFRASPFSRDAYSALELSVVGTRVMEDLGKVKAQECRLMKDELMTRDKHGTGLVPLALFYAQWNRSRALHYFEYVETAEHLQAIGALDETSARHPQVRIVNYILGPANCGARTSTAATCCMSECEPVVREIESHVRAPTATADRLIGVVGNVSTLTVDAPRRLPPGLAQRLRDIAAKRRGGLVPLHGRLFAEWLHFAFPHECPFPHAVGDAAVHSVGFWDGQHVAHNDTEQEEVRARFAVAPDEELHSGPTDHGARSWVEEEVLLMEVPGGWAGPALRGAAQAAAVMAACGALLRAAWAAWPGAGGGKGGWAL